MQEYIFEEKQICVVVVNDPINLRFHSFINFEFADVLHSFSPSALLRIHNIDTTIVILVNVVNLICFVEILPFSCIFFVFAEFA